MEKIASWNPRAKYYVITKKGTFGIVDRTAVGEPPPDDCELKNCTGDEWQKFIDDVETQRQIFEKRDINKKKDSLPESGSSLKPKQNESNDSENNDKGFFKSMFGV